MKQDTPLVSILMPAFNVEQYIADSIKSVIDQTYQNWELIIINDGSTDSTREICLEFKNSDERIKFVENEENKGLIFTRNRGLELSTGKYIANLDSDDLALPNRLSIQVKFMEQNINYVLLGSGCETIDSKGKKVGQENRPIKNGLIKSLLYFGNYFINSSVIMRRSELKGITYKEGFAPAEDYQLFTQLLLKGEIGNLDKQLVQYRIHDSNISTLKKEQQQRSIKQIHKNQLEKLKIEPSAEESELHFNLVEGNTNAGKSELEAVESWLLKLREANISHKACNEETFNYWCAFFFKRACENSKLGIKSINRYRISKLSKGIKIGLKSNLAFFVKSILNK